MTRTKILILAAACAAAQLNAETYSVEAGKELLESYGMKAPRSFALKNSSGNIRVVEAAGDTIGVRAVNTGSNDGKIKVTDQNGTFSVEVVKSAQNIEVNGDGISIGSINSNGQVTITQTDGNGNSTTTVHVGTSIDLEIAIPKKFLADLVANNSSGNISFDGEFETLSAARQICLATSSGAIQCRNAKAGKLISAESSSGRINLSSVEGPVGVTTAHGAVELQNVRGSASINTSSGSVRSSDGEGDFQFKTTSGSIAVHGHRSGALRGRTTSGSVKMTDLPAGVSDSFRTTSGRITRE